jgi:hypothetical protein
MLSEIINKRFVSQAQNTLQGNGTQVVRASYNSAVEHFPYMSEVLRSTPSTAKINKA